MYVLLHFILTFPSLIRVFDAEIELWRQNFSVKTILESSKVEINAFLAVGSILGFNSVIFTSVYFRKRTFVPLNRITLPVKPNLT